MKIILTFSLLCLFSHSFSQYRLTRIGLSGEINVKAKATNSQPLLVVQNVVYSIPEKCFCNRDLGDNTSGRSLGRDDSKRDKDSQNAGRNTDGDQSKRNASNDDSGREAGEDNSGRTSGTAFGYRDLDGDGEERASGKDDSDRNSDTDNTGRNSNEDSKGRNSGNAANNRYARSDNLDRGIATAYTPPSCYKIKDSCSIQILGFHPKASIEYFDKMESVKAHNMIIQF